MTDVYAAGEDQIEGVSSQLILDKVTNQHKSYVPLDDLEDTLLQMAQKGDIILMMGAGNIWRHSVKLAQMIEEKYK